MLVIITTVNYSPASPVELEIPDDAQVKDVSLRISRTATLDGYCTIDNMGLSHSDRTLKLQADRCSEETAAALWTLFQQGISCCLAVGDEMFQGYVSKYREVGSTITFTFLVEKRLSV